MPLEPNAGTILAVPVSPMMALEHFPASCAHAGPELPAPSAHQAQLSSQMNETQLHKEHMKKTAKSFFRSELHLKDVIWISLHTKDHEGHG